MKQERVFYVATLGNAAGTITVGNRIMELAPGKSVIQLQERELESGVIFRSLKGKFADSEDSFLFCYTEVDPFSEDFCMSAIGAVTDTGMLPDFHTGYGIAVVDTVQSKGSFSRHRNHVAAGRFRTAGGLQHGKGVRVITGYTDSAACDQYGRIADTSGQFVTQKKSDDIVTGDTDFFSIRKNSEGFLCSCDGEEIKIAGHDCLMGQNDRKLFAGFAVAGKVEVSFRKISFEILPGAAAVAPSGKFSERIMDYPFERSLISRCREASAYFKEHGAICVGKEVCVPDGIYEPDQSLILGEDDTVLKAEHPGKVVLSGRKIKEKIPLFLLSGDFCIIDGIAFRESLSSGLFVYGSHNRICSCEAYGNGDTGFLICSLPGTEKEKWPGGNIMESCISHDNCDTAFYNADGFGAKLRIGEGNAFIDCVAHHNVDDGFDLFTKANFGFTGRVNLKNCTAFENGKLSDGSFARNREGSGFKLGGERIGIAHNVTYCKAWGNNGRGIDRNTNPFPVLRDCRSWKNGVSDSIMKKAVRIIPRRSRTMNPNRRTVLFIIPSLSGGGAERVTINLANSLCGKYNVSIAYYIDSEIKYPTDPRVNLVHFSGKHVKLCGKIDLYNRLRRFICGLRDVLSIWQLKRNLETDICVSMLDYPNMLNALSGGCRMIMSERNDPEKKGRNYWQSENFCFRRADAVVFQTEKVKRMFSAVIQQKGTVILNPVDIPVRASGHGVQKIVTAGRLNKQKNHALLLCAFAEFRKDHPGHELFIYGDGPEKESLKELAKKYGIEDRVHFEGYCTDIHERIKDAEFFVLTSDFEGLPNALMEAMAMGIPCISTACTGAEELITDGKSGLLIPVGDMENLWKAMEKLSGSEELRKVLSMNAVTAAASFTSEKVAEKWEKVFVNHEERY